jgi:hypothetical protein
MNGKALLACIALSGTLVSCIPRRAWTTEDSWYNPPSQGALVGQGQGLDRARIHEVVESRQAEAEELLEDVSVVELTHERAAEFISQELPEAAGAKPYLIRGVYLARGTGSFSVTIYEDQLVVHHGSLGSGGYRMGRQALVLQLERAPAEVFVTCSIAR